MVLKRQIVVEEGSDDAKEFFAAEAKKTVAKFEKALAAATKKLDELTVANDELQSELEWEKQRVQTLKKLARELQTSGRKWTKAYKSLQDLSEIGDSIDTVFQAFEYT